MSLNAGRQCVETFNHSNIKLSGVRTSVLYIENAKSRAVKRSELDGCLHPEGKICDWLVETADGKEPQIQIFVELKGKKWEEAAVQLEQALETYPPNKKGYRTRCYIVGRSFPAYSTSKQKLESRFQSRYSVPLLTAKDGQTVGLEK